jgi:hypothetical protein
MEVVYLIDRRDFVDGGWERGRSSRPRIRGIHIHGRGTAMVWPALPITIFFYP